MQETTSMDVARALGRKNHGNFLISLRRIEAKTGYSFTKAMRTIGMKHGFSKECPYYKLTIEDCNIIKSYLTKPEEKEIMTAFISALFSKEKPAIHTSKALASQPRIELFKSDGFGELHVTFDTDQLWYCLSDNDGLLSVIIESKKSKANSYRKWVTNILPTKQNVAPAIVPECYPTLDEYFTLYVPAPEFHEALSEVNAHCLTAAGRSGMNSEKRKSLIRDVGILNTFCDTLKAVYQLA